MQRRQGRQTPRQRGTDLLAVGFRAIEAQRQLRADRRPIGLSGRAVHSAAVGSAVHSAGLSEPAQSRSERGH
jgi:hypothetical protein